MDGDDRRGRAAASVLRRFRWTEGHADFSAVLADGGTLGLLGPALAQPFHGSEVSVVLAPEARGFVLGALVAADLGIGLVLARKPGSVHPGGVVEVTSRPDWRGRNVVFRIARVIAPGARVLLVDDWIETGSQAFAVADAIDRFGAALVGVSVVVDDTTEEVRRRLGVVGLLSGRRLPAN